MNKNVLITGGSGFVGRALANSLLTRGYSVTILTRKMAGNALEKNLNYALWDIKKQQIDIQAVQQADFIVHLAGAGGVDKKWTTTYKSEIVESRTASSRLIISALQQTPNNVKAVISTSAIGFYGPDKATGTAFIETDKADENFLGYTCQLWEQSIEPVCSLGIRLVKLRTGIVLGKGGGALDEFKKPIRFGLAVILGNGRQVVSWIHIDDLCKMYINAIENEELHGTYNAVAPHPVSNQTLTLTLAKAMNRKFYIPLHVPAFVLKIMMGQRSIEVLKSATVSSKKIVNTGFLFKYNEIETALKSLTVATNQH